MDFTLSEEYRMLQSTVRDFANTTLVPEAISKTAMDKDGSGSTRPFNQV